MPDTCRVVAKDELDNLLTHHHLGRHVPLLFLANKIDLPTALAPVELAQVSSSLDCRSEVIGGPQARHICMGLHCNGGEELAGALAASTMLLNVAFVSCQSLDRCSISMCFS